MPSKGKGSGGILSLEQRQQRLQEIRRRQSNRRRSLMLQTSSTRINEVPNNA